MSELIETPTVQQDSPTSASYLTDWSDTGTVCSCLETARKGDKRRVFDVPPEAPTSRVINWTQA